MFLQICLLYERNVLDLFTTYVIVIFCFLIIYKLYTYQNYTYKIPLTFNLGIMPWSTK
jgi:hypothetical protein